MKMYRIETPYGTYNGPLDDQTLVFLGGQTPTWGMLRPFERDRILAQMRQTASEEQKPDPMKGLGKQAVDEYQDTMKARIINLLRRPENNLLKFGYRQGVNYANERLAATRPTVVDLALGMKQKSNPDNYLSRFKQSMSSINTINPRDVRQVAYERQGVINPNNALTASLLRR